MALIAAAMMADWRSGECGDRSGEELERGKGTGGDTPWVLSSIGGGWVMLGACAVFG